MLRGHRRADWDGVVRLRFQTLPASRCPFFTRFALYFLTMFSGSWDTVIKPVADKFRALLGQDALICKLQPTRIMIVVQNLLNGWGSFAAFADTNECGGEQMWNSTAIANGWKIPASLDIVSTDYYAGWLPTGTACPKSGKCAYCPSCPCFNTCKPPKGLLVESSYLFFRFLVTNGRAAFQRVYARRGLRTQRCLK